MTHHRLLAAPAACLLATCVLIKSASAASGDDGFLDLLDHRCPTVTQSQLHDASWPYQQCILAKAREFEAADGSNVELAGKATLACEAKRAPLRKLLARCAGDKIESAMDDYQAFALGYLVGALVRGDETHLAETVRGEVTISAGPAFEALVEHATCMSLAGFSAAEKLSSQDAAIAEAEKQCQRTAAVLDQAIQTSFQPDQVEGARDYARIEATLQVAMEFRARHGAPREDAEPALATGGAETEAEAIDRVLAERCGASMDRLQQAIAAHNQCEMAKIAELADETRSDSERAELAFAACASAQDPIRGVLGQCAGDAADKAMQSYLSFAHLDLVKVQIEGVQQAVAKTAQVKAMPAEGPVFDALVDHLVCVSQAGRRAAETSKDRAAALARADTECTASAKALADAASANLSPEDATFELGYARTATADEAGREFDAARRAARAR